MTTPEEQVRAEAELARRLTQAPEDERRRLYGPAYDRIYDMHFSRDPDVLDFGATIDLLPMLLHLTEPGDRVLEIGCGAGLLAIELANAGRRVTGVEVSNVILDAARTRAGDIPVEFEHVEGVGLPYTDSSFEFAYSIEVVEHLHEQDARAHFAEVRRVLVPRGRYWFLTPSRLAPSSASERFGVTGEADHDVHLKEWTYRELRPALQDAGFEQASMPLHDVHGLRLPRVPLTVAALLERAVPPGLLFKRLGLSRCSVVARR